MAGVRTTAPDYDRLIPLWERAADIVAGQERIHAKKETYLPKLTGESDTDYKGRLSRSEFFNATWRTVAGLTGMAFRKEPVIDAPTAIEEHLDDIDLAGTSLDIMAKALVMDSLIFGLYGLLVDFPAVDAAVYPISQAAAETLGLRPVVHRYEMRSIINWRYARRDNRRQLVMVVLAEETELEEQADEYTHECETRYRVLDLDPRGFYRQRVYRINKRGEDEQVGADFYPLMRGAPLPYLPFKIFGEMTEPPLIDLIDKNIAHYQVNSDYRHGLHLSALPTAVVSGYTKAEGERLYIGSRAAWVFPDPTAKATFLEFTGAGLGAIDTAIGAIEKQMAVLGARMIADETKQVETLGATEIKRAGENSILADVAIAVSESIEWALGVFCEWVGVTGEISYQINREYNPTGLDAPRLTALLANVQAGKISEREYFELLQRADIIDSGKSYEEHQAEIDIAALPAPALPALDTQAA